MNHQDLLEQAIAELELKTDGHHGVWNLRDHLQWNVDLSAGIIVFTMPDNITVTCPVQVVGTFNTLDSTWLWGWNHPSVPTALGAHAQCVHDYGVQENIAEYTTLQIETTEDKCWEYTALACKLGEAQGGYRGPSGPTLVFMTFGKPSISKD